MRCQQVTQQRVHKSRQLFGGSSKELVDDGSDSLADDDLEGVASTTGARDGQLFASSSFHHHFVQPAHQFPSPNDW